MDAINAHLSLNGLEAELGIVPHTGLCRPLQQVVDAGIAASVIEVLTVESVFHHAALQVEHLDVPVLSSVAGIGFFADNGCIVVAIVSIAQHQFGLCHGAYAVSEVVVKAGGSCLADAEVCRLVALCLALCDECNAAIVLQACCHVGAVGGYEYHILSHGLGFPQLGFVRTVVLAGLHASLAGGAECQVAERIDETP